MGSKGRPLFFIVFWRVPGRPFIYKRLNEKGAPGGEGGEGPTWRGAWLSSVGLRCTYTFWYSVNKEGVRDDSWETLHHQAIFEKGKRAKDFLLGKTIINRTGKCNLRSPSSSYNLARTVVR